jgi:putative transcriptional regulator
MMRVRLKADGRLVEILADGRERPLPPARPEGERYVDAPSISPDRPMPALRPIERPVDAAYAKNVRSATRLTQAEFAARIGVPIETVRNWEQGKRSPRGPARALLKLIDQVPDVAFSVLGPSRPQRPAN